MNRSLKEWIVRSVILMIGLVIAHLGVTLFLLSDLGSDPFNVLVQGLFRQLSGVPSLSFLTHGRTHMTVSLMIIVILFFTARSYVKIGTLLCMICGGPIIDFFTWLLRLILPQDLSLPARIAMLVLGCVILAYGMTIVIKSDAGTGPNDLVAVVITDKLHGRFGSLPQSGILSAVPPAQGRSSASPLWGRLPVSFFPSTGKWSGGYCRSFHFK